MKFLENIFARQQQPQQPKPQQQQPQQQPQQVTQHPQPATNAPAPAATNDPNVQPAFQQSTTGQPQQNQAAQTSAQPQSPLDAFKDLFDNTQSKEQQAAEQVPQQAISLNVEELKKAVEGMSFTPSGEQAQELMQKLAAGDTDAVLQLVNQSNRNMYVNQATLMQNLMNKLAEQLTSQWQEQLPQHIKKATAQDQLLGKNQLYKNEAFKPVVMALQNQFATKYPHADASEINAQVESYLQAMQSALGGQQQQAQQQQQQNSQGETDWSKLFFPS